MPSTPAKRAEPAYRVDYEDEDLVIRIPSTLISRDRVSQFLDYLILEQGSRELNLSDEEIAELAAEAKRSSWQRLRPMVEEKLRGP
ncbi:MAG TPA: hypothetical protein VJT67_14010 [Longimicrobiaceae bacterium]|nr:hypothetical protein [Longimicrobiaceae bacterium]